MIAVADTGPLLYLSLIGQTKLLPEIFDRVLIPHAVEKELTHQNTPAVAAAIIQEKPNWLEIRPVDIVSAELFSLDAGEQEVISLALSIPEAVLLVDDRRAKSIATQLGVIAASGTYGVLYAAARNDSVMFTAVDFDQAHAALRSTNFRHSVRLLKKIQELSRELHLHEASKRKET